MIALDRALARAQRALASKLALASYALSLRASNPPSSSTVKVPLPSLSNTEKAFRICSRVAPCAVPCALRPSKATDASRNAAASRAVRIRIVASSLSKSDDPLAAARPGVLGVVGLDAAIGLGDAVGLGDPVDLGDAVGLDFGRDAYGSPAIFELGRKTKFPVHSSARDRRKFRDLEISQDGNTPLS